MVDQPSQQKFDQALHIFLRIFAAQSYTKNNVNNTGSGDETGTVKLYRLKYIPANQGVVLYSPNSPLGNGTPTKLEVVPAYSATVKRYSSNAFDYLERWADSQEKESIWVNEHTSEKWKNYIDPIYGMQKNWLAMIYVIVILVGGSVMVMWLGERIT